ncbi:class I SAM-dependent methyltransferase [Stappia indica]|uniref:class I SAM-dependent methyltransferase n=1 Tax=Stappia indica TaxID=538381 RepID=UPI001CD7883F|nr:methyltransferase domain-containing protein [Stappia indica]MCA1300512.1 methyltransferase domain-containing protein [Stappia indica]
MLEVSTRKVRGFTAKMADEIRFIRSWAENPLTTGAVSPSGPDLTRRMAAYIEAERPGQVLEIGPGTGVVTHSILERGIGPERVIALEYNDNFCRLLRRRYPDMQVVEGDAYRLRETLADVPAGSLASIVSSMPLFSRPKEERRSLLFQAFELLQPGAPFIQFSYAMVAPIALEPGVFTVERSGWILKNLPPARVWVYRKTV